MNKINFLAFCAFMLTSIFILPSTLAYAQIVANSTSDSTVGSSGGSTANSQPQIEASGEQEAVSISVKGIILTQGESGAETWRMNATAANMDQETGLVSVKNPRITYFLKNNNREMHIQSQHGTVEQSQSQVELWGEVRVDEAENLLTTSRAQYDGGTQVLTLPEALEFFNPMFLGSASSANWNLNTNILNASGAINVTISSKKKPKK